jgi:hypothetical protein
VGRSPDQIDGQCRRAAPSANNPERTITDMGLFIKPPPEDWAERQMILYFPGPSASTASRSRCLSSTCRRSARALSAAVDRVVSSKQRSSCYRLGSSSARCVSEFLISIMSPDAMLLADSICCTQVKLDATLTSPDPL